MPDTRDRVVIDTNLWISFLLTKDYTRLDRILSDRLITLIFSEELLDEFIDVARRPKFKKYFSLPDLQQLLTQLREQADFVDVTSKVDVCRDPKDNFLLSLAMDGKATHLITGDRDLLDLNSFGLTQIVTLTNYLSDINHP